MLKAHFLSLNLLKIICDSIVISVISVTYGTAITCKKEISKLI